MAWETELIIDGGTTSAGLVAGQSTDPRADYGKIGVTSTAESVVGELDNYEILNGGSVWVKGGILSGGTVHSGGRIIANGLGARVVDLTIESGGQLFVYSNHTHLAGNINLASGAWVQCPDAFTGVDGVISGGATISSFFYIESGVRFRDFTVTKASTYVSSAAAIYDLTVSGATAATTVFIFDGGTVSGADILVGNIAVSSGGTVGGIRTTVADAFNPQHGATLLGGNTFTAGAWANNAAAFTGEDGVISGAVLNRDLTIADGIVFSGLNCNAASRTLNISSGAALYDPILASQGVSLRVCDGGYISGGTMIPAYVNLQISSGGVAEGISMPGGQLHVSEGGVLSNVDISGGSVYVSGGALASGGTITEAAGFMIVYSGGTAADVTVTNGILAPSSSATISGATIGAGGFFRANDEYIHLLGTNNFALGTWQSNTAAFTGEDGIISGAVLNRNLTIADGVIFSGLQFNVNSKTLQVSSGAAVYDPVMLNKGTAIDLFDGAYVSGGTMVYSLAALRISSGGVAESVAMPGGQLHVSEGGIASKVDIGGGTAYVSEGGLVAGGSISSGLILVYDGGEVAGVTATGGSIRVSAGATASGITAAGAACLQIYDGVTLLGRNDITLGAWYQNTTAFTGEDGIISGAVLKQNLTIGSGVSFGGLTFNSNKELHVGSGAALYDPSLTSTGVNVYVYDGALVSGGSMTRGTLTVRDGVVSDVDVRSGDLMISGGRVDLPSGGTFSGNLTFDLTGKSGQETALLTGAANLSGAAISILADTETIANYVLADGDLGNYSINGASRVSGTTYNDFATGIAYKLAGGTLSVAEYVEPEVNPAASIIAAANAVVDVATGGTVYTGRINGGSTTVTGQYFAAGTDTGSKDLLLEVTNGINTGIIAAGANAGGAVGTGKVKVTGGSTLLLLGGGNTGATQSKAVVEVAGGEVGTLYGGGKQGGYADGIDVTLTGTATVNNIYAGVLHTSGTGNFTIGGEINLDIDAGAVTGFVFGGGKVSVSGSESVTFNNDINITVDGGTFGSGVYALGYAKGTDKTKTALTMASTQEVNVSITGGTFNSNVYLGALTDTAITSGASLKASVTGGKISGLYGGGLAQRGGTANAGAVTISVSGGEIDAIIGGGSHVNKDDGNSTTVDSVAIDVSGGTIGSIYAGGHYNTTLAGYFGSDTVTHDAVVTLSGDAEVGKAAGSWHGLNTVGGQRKLVFDDFTGTCGTVCDWDLITFDGENNTTADLSSSTIFDVGCWSFDVIGREANAGTALVDIGDWFGSKATIDLHITDAAASLTTWSLAEFDGSLGELTFNVYDAASTELARGLAFEDKITTGTFTNYGFSIDDATNTLQFGLLSA